jgi:hypothetical protein
MYPALRRRLAGNARLKMELGRQIRPLKEECHDSGRSGPDRKQELKMLSETDKRVIEQQRVFRQADRAMKKLKVDLGIEGPFCVEGVGGHPELLKIYTLAAAKEAENPPVIALAPEIGGAVC